MIDQPPDQTRPDSYPFPPGEIEENLLYCNNNPEGDPCPICAPDIGRVFAPGTEPHVPRHDNCYCYYTPTQRAPSPVYQSLSAGYAQAGTGRPTRDTPR